MAIDETAYGAHHPEVDRDLNNLATVLRGLGDLDSARPLLERALAIDEAAYGPHHPEVGRDVTNLATVLRGLGNLTDARRLLERALAIAEAAHGPDHHATMAARRHLSSLRPDLLLPPSDGAPS